MLRFHGREGEPQGGAALNVRLHDREREHDYGFGEDDICVGTCYTGEERLPAVPPEQGQWSAVALRHGHWRKELYRSAMLRSSSEAKQPVRHDPNTCATPCGV